MPVYLYNTGERNARSEPVNDIYSDVQRMTPRDRGILIARIELLENGVGSLHRNLQGGVGELKINDKLRIYYAQLGDPAHGGHIVLLEAGNDKNATAQYNDIKRAQEYRKDLMDRLKAERAGGGVENDSEALDKLFRRTNPDAIRDDLNGSPSRTAKESEKRTNPALQNVRPVRAGLKDTSGAGAEQRLTQTPSASGRDSPQGSATPTRGANALKPDLHPEPHAQPVAVAPGGSGEHLPPASGKVVAISTGKGFHPAVQGESTAPPVAAAAETETALTAGATKSAAAAAAGKLPLKIGVAALPAASGAIIEGTSAALHGKSGKEIAKAAGHGAVNGAFGVEDAKTAWDPHQRPVDRVLAGARSATATAATGFGVASLTPAAPVTAPIAAGAAITNQALGVVQDGAYWAHLANNPGTLTNTYHALQDFERQSNAGGREMAAHNSALSQATGKGTLADYYEQALTSGNKEQAETARAEYTQHLQNLLVHGKISKETYEAVDKLARGAYDAAEKQGFKPPAQQPSAHAELSPLDKARSQAMAALQGNTVPVRYTGEHDNAAYVASVVDMRGAQAHTPAG